MSIKQRLALIGGAGTIGMAIVRGLLRAGALAPDRMTVTARHEGSLQRLEQYGVARTRDNRAAAEAADVLLICVHPDQVAGVLDEVRDTLREGQLILSVATGIPTSRIEELAGDAIPVIRATPNLAAVVGASITVLCAGRFVTEQHLELAREVFRTVGEVEQLDERHMNACTALCGCGPAFVFKCIEALAQGGVKMGLPRLASRRMAAQVMLGAAHMVLQTGEHPAALKDQVTTPGGCTIDGITKLEERGLSIALIEAVETSAIKAAKLFDS
ncbi:MAG: pyrroline-5-carboxylate reductase [bacterium]